MTTISNTNGTSNWPIQGQNPLYRAQEASSLSVRSYYLPSYTDEYARDRGCATYCYTKVYNGLSAIGRVAYDALLKTIRVIRTIVSFCFGWALGGLFNRINDAINPINPINGKRHLILIPKSVEKFLGDWLIYPMETCYMTETSELMRAPNNQSSVQNERIETRVDNVMKRILQAPENLPLLNPQGEIAFDYRVKTVASSHLNAFAVPGGGMVVFSQLVKEIEGSILSKEFQSTQVQLADGSSVCVDLSKINVDDVLGALLGHEMTHAASRHSIVTMFATLICSIVISNLRLLFDRFELLADVLDEIEDQINNLFTLFQSRIHEYEADSTGAYLAQKAGFNPLGAIYLQELFTKKSGNYISRSIHKNLEFLFTHPYGENRKRALLAAIGEFDQNPLAGCVTAALPSSTVQNRYRLETSSPAVQYGAHLRTQLGG